MGNCMDCQKKPAGWAAAYDDEQWEYVSVEHENRARANYARAEADGGGAGEGLLRPLTDEDHGGGSNTEIKIKISKKELEKMLQQMGASGKGSAAGRAQLQHVLADLVSFGQLVPVQDDLQEEEEEVGHWRPTLQSIAE